MDFARPPCVGSLNARYSAFRSIKVLGPRFVCDRVGFALSLRCVYLQRPVPGWTLVRVLDSGQARVEVFAFPQPLPQVLRLGSQSRAR